MVDATALTSPATCLRAAFHSSKVRGTRVATKASRALVIVAKTLTCTFLRNGSNSYLCAPPKLRALRPHLQQRRHCLLHCQCVRGARVCMGALVWGHPCGYALYRVAASSLWRRSSIPTRCRSGSHPEWWLTSLWTCVDQKLRSTPLTRKHAPRST